MVAMLIAIVLISPFVAVIIALTVIAAIFCAHGQKRARSAASSSTSSSSGSMPVESEHGEERDATFMANVRTHMRARIEETTRAGYDGALKRVAQWLVEDGHPELVDESGAIRSKSCVATRLQMTTASSLRFSRVPASGVTSRLWWTCRSSMTGPLRRWWTCAGSL